MPQLAVDEMIEFVKNNKDIMVDSNKMRAADGCQLRKAKWAELTALLASKFPGYNPTVDTIQTKWKNEVSRIKSKARAFKKSMTETGNADFLRVIMAFSKKFYFKEVERAVIN
jgi:hypothetical protein